MDVSDLKLFEAVARLGAMNRAAAALNTVQSNVTARIRALEEELGQALNGTEDNGPKMGHRLDLHNDWNDHRATADARGKSG